MSNHRSCGLVLACAALMAAVAGAAQYNVGGDSGWGVPGAGAESYNTWAEKTTFQVGDQLVFVYPKDKDSVLLVAPADYNACNTNTYDKQFTDGNTVFDLDRAGAFFFISGVDANCRANEKLIVMVAAAAKGAPTPSQGSPAATATTPPSSPSGGAPPNSPAAPNAPAGNSTPAKDAPPGAASGAGLTVAGLAGSFVALFGYAMLAF
ncbi:hypothetical protein CFC21_091992 [Triticum aestivum]|uniref:Phytocyanin domain-containing protein n=4 Tax=Triticinae TaxID=1648030 RepID=A0A3B6QBY5_WHEAT|nr:early nodulin-like protein 1 [Aegilops tauschii subsp. strangulata]XP_044418876.1 early nodulin-like protein 1 [Triticum aestivum]KAF7088922.1 hypothetical protein CFC21_091992 [Triticum aestivum]